MRHPQYGQEAHPEFHSDLKLQYEQNSFPSHQLSPPRHQQQHQPAEIAKIISPSFHHEDARFADIRPRHIPSSQSKRNRFRNAPPPHVRKPNKLDYHDEYSRNFNHPEYVRPRQFSEIDHPGMLYSLQGSNFHHDDGYDRHFDPYSVAPGPSTIEHLYPPLSSNFNHHPRNHVNPLSMHGPETLYNNHGPMHRSRRNHYHSRPSRKYRNPIVKTTFHKPDRYKTELCRHFMETGNCTFERECQFAHDISELKNVRVPKNYKTKVCKKYAATTNCAYGHRCIFIHHDAGDSMRHKERQKTRYLHMKMQRIELKNRQMQQEIDSFRKLEFVPELELFKHDSYEEQQPNFADLRAPHPQKLETNPYEHRQQQQSHELLQTKASASPIFSFPTFEPAAGKDRDLHFSHPTAEMLQERKNDNNGKSEEGPMQFLKKENLGEVNVEVTKSEIAQEKKDDVDVSKIQEGLGGLRFNETNENEVCNKGIDMNEDGLLACPLKLNE